MSGGNTASLHQFALTLSANPECNLPGSQARAIASSRRYLAVLRESVQPDPPRLTATQTVAWEGASPCGLQLCRPDRDTRTRRTDWCAFPVRVDSPAAAALTAPLVHACVTH